MTLDAHQHSIAGPGEHDGSAGSQSVRATAIPVANLPSFIPTGAPKPRSVPEFHAPDLAAFVGMLGLPLDKVTFYFWRELSGKKRIIHPSGDVIGWNSKTIDTIKSRSRDGWNVSMMLHPMSGKWHGKRRSRASDDVLQWGCNSLDFDNGLPAVWPHGLVPTLIVETSPGHYQAHWMLSEPADQSEGFALQQRMGDAMPSRDRGAMIRTQGYRPPGTRNTKRDAGDFLATLHTNSGKRYSFAELLAAFPPVATSWKAGPIAPMSEIDAGNMPAMIAELCADPAFRVDGRKDWISLGRILHALTGGADYGFEDWHAVSANSPGYASGKDCEQTWRGFGRTRFTADWRALFGIAKKCGVNVSEFRKRWPNVGRTVKSAPFCQISNARFGTKLYCELGLTAREVHRQLHRLHDRTNNGRIPFTIDELARVTGFDRKTVNMALGELYEDGVTMIRRKPARRAPGLIELCDSGTDHDGKSYQNAPALDWSKLPRVEAMNNDGQLIEAMNRQGRAHLPYDMLLSPAWRALHPAERELIAFMLSAYSTGKNGDIHASENFIANSTGMERRFVHDVIKAVCSKGMLGRTVKGKRRVHDKQNVFVVAFKGTGFFDVTTRKYAITPTFKWPKDGHFGG